MAKKRDRIFILVIVAAFVFTTFGTILGAIYANSRQEKIPQADAQTETQTDPAKNNPNALKGKQMQDFTPVAKIEKLQVVDLQPGTGDEVKAGANVTVDYTGAVASTGKVFESSFDSGQKATFGLDQVITGWKDGLVGMKVGGKRRLMIPAEQAYGPQSPSPEIPANSDLVFDITLYSVNK